MVAIIRKVHQASPHLWQVRYDLPLFEIAGISSEIAATEADARAGAAKKLRARGFRIIVSDE